ncbi:RNA-DNA hybrid ribonuclease NDAI_0E00670 [Naumovozyma dairenensis CBS 421]|uniref:Ribonuclease H n=1 Tax=Naumovozyma dairenensis (strain ATCC 10597 / BCRC 20456 / CBS 421 / NBRC 0211 / NRRL Y-12639) TaxID=1071378 RepID=G0WAW3_NAUDC|nr:hypothetical protein NDAI_0E00670 [Naumovozyma dairenensis CBS 421]CCD24883.1 hypothetical protein NDAI_0E00670 [Naumovozyma dairenensis CBS 421]
MGPRAFYGVNQGFQRGVFYSWHDCEQQVKGYKGAIFKKFNSFEEAKNFAHGTSSNNSNNRGLRNENNNSKIKNRMNNARAPDVGIRKQHSLPSHLPRDAAERIVKHTKFYAVKSGNPTVQSMIFRSWPECKSYIYRQKGLSFKSFDSLEDAENFINGVSNPSLDYDLMGVRSLEFQTIYKLNPFNTAFYTSKCNVYCDGSSLGNGKYGARAGYGVFFETQPSLNISDRLRIGAQTNNRGEIQAVSEALKAIWKILSTSPNKLNFQIITDSEYVAKLLNDRYMTYSIDKIHILPNHDLIVPLLAYFTCVKKYYEINADFFANKGNFKIEWVKGHAGHYGNEMADELARRGASMD